MGDIDERYKRGKIYTIRCYSDNTKIYVGSTIDTLTNRLGRHKADSKTEKYKNNMILYKTVNDDWSDWYIELFQLWPCNNRAELTQQEGKHIREIGSLNKYIAGRTQKEYYIENKDIINEKHKQYIIKNKDYIDKYQKKYYIENKDIIIEKGKKYYIENKKEYYIKNKDFLIEKNKKYYNDNNDIINERTKVKVVCEHCNSSIRKDGLKQHQKSAKCIKVQNNNIVVN